MYNVYTGERIRLRPFKDVEELESVLYALELIDFGNWHPNPWTCQAMRKGFAENSLLPARGAGFWAIERLDTGAAAGYSYIVLPAPGEISAEIGTMLLPDHHGLRLGVESKEISMSILFENYPLHAVVAGTLSSNVGAVRSLKLAGMQCIGTERRMYTRNGQARDGVAYAIYREDWENHPMRSNLRRGAEYEC